MRKLASIQRIAEIKPIPEADMICAYRVNGWWIVSKVNEFKLDELVVYIECDVWVPNSLAPFLSKGKDPKQYEGILGERLRTIKLKKQLSQGLLLPVFKEEQEDIPVAPDPYVYLKNKYGAVGLFKEGEDVSNQLGVTKWEPAAEFKAANAKGTFPIFIPKTDQERVQNCYREMVQLDTTWEVTEKLEGSSHTAYFNNGVYGVCSRNLELKTNEPSTFVDVAANYQLEDKLRAFGRNMALQSEMIGPNIQGNIYKMDSHKLYVYDIFDIDKQEYLSPTDRWFVLGELQLQGVPVMHPSFNIKEESCDTLLDQANGCSSLNPNVLREGLVFKAYDTNASFKVVSNEYLLKQK
jgi:RNA ligase (TIGR02306 family)